MVAGFAILLAFLLPIFTPRSLGDNRAGGPEVAGIPTSMLLPVIGISGVLFGLAWMWRIYKVPTKYESAHWRYRDHG
jgi:hypothetical protein